VYGPGHTSHSLTANAIISAFLKKGIAFIPSPGTYQVCFAYVDDVVHGHVQAMAKGTAGETYILGGNNVSYLQFFDHIRKLSGGKGRILAVPKPLIKAAAYAQEISHQLTGSNIRFTVRSVDHLFNNYTFSSQKAVSQLGYRITPLEEALQQTVWFLKNDTHA
jgi:nucleoside-diphosphate-sugar epimerase